ncbi:MAG: helix-turn-helix domain-containing protein [Devosia sp.]
MRFTDSLTDEAVLAELGQRVMATRLARRMTQADLALAAGVSKRTVERLEDGQSSQLSNLIRCLRALGRIEALDALLPEQPANPIDQLTRRRPVRVRGGRGLAEAPARRWIWGDETGGDATRGNKTRGDKT